MLLHPEEQDAALDDLARLTSSPHRVPLRRRSQWRTRDGEGRLVDWGKGVLLEEEGSLTQVVITGIAIDDDAEAPRLGSFEWDIVENRLTWRTSCTASTASTPAGSSRRMRPSWGACTPTTARP